MKAYSLFVSILFFAYQTSAECIQAGEHCECNGGSVADIDKIRGSITSININNMPIGRMDGTLFSRFTDSLTNVSCSHCRLIDIEPNAFSGLTKLTELHLTHNNLRKIKAVWFGETLPLTKLYLGNNKIDEIDEQAFRRLPELRHLGLDGNNLRELFTMWFGKTVPLNSFSARDNKIDYFDIKLIGQGSKLSNLDVSGNQLECFFIWHVMRSRVIQVRKPSDRWPVTLNVKSNYCVRCMRGLSWFRERYAGITVQMD